MPVHCKNCHNSQLWSFNYGKRFDYSTLYYMRERADLFECIAAIGGEPLDQDQDEFKTLMIFLSKMFDTKEFWLFTRYEMDEIPAWCKGVFHYIKTGKYIEELKQEGFPASSNQKLLKRGIDY